MKWDVPETETVSVMRTSGADLRVEPEKGDSDASKRPYDP